MRIYVVQRIVLCHLIIPHRIYLPPNKRQYGMLIPPAGTGPTPAPDPAPSGAAPPAADNPPSATPPPPRGGRAHFSSPPLGVRQPPARSWQCHVLRLHRAASEGRRPRQSCTDPPPGPSWCPRPADRRPRTISPLPRGPPIHPSGFILLRDPGEQHGRAPRSAEGFPVEIVGWLSGGMPRADHRASHRADA